MKKILVPTDFAAHSQAAHEWGLQLALKTGAELHFLHISNTPVSWLKTPLSDQHKYPETLDHISQVNAEFDEISRKAEAVNVVVKTFHLFDQPHQSIVEHIGAHNHDFVIIGTDGGNALGPLVPSTESLVMQQATCPVLLVKSGQEYAGIESIMVASDLTQEEQKALDVAAELARLFNSSLDVVHIVTPYQFQEASEAKTRSAGLSQSFGQMPVNFHTFNALNVERGILYGIDELQPDLVLMGTHGRGGILKQLAPSIAKKMAESSSIPLITVRI